MKTSLVLIASIVLLLVSINTSSKTAKEVNHTLTEGDKMENILVFIFPGAKSHTFIFRELFKYTLERIKGKNVNMKYKFHLLVHNFDKPLWEGSPHNIIGYGDVKSYEDKFFKAMAMAKDDPVMGYNNFNKAMIHLYQDFLKDGIIDEIRGNHYDLLISDIVNVVSILLKKELSIEKYMYVNPTCVYTWLNESFEYNAAYHPLIGSKSTEVMGFFERFTNHFFLQATRIMYAYFQEIQQEPFRQYGYNEYMDPFAKDAFFLNQCVNGVHYAYPFPPNYISMGAVLPKPSSPLKDHKIIDFLNKYEKTIYVSQGTITKALRLEIITEVFNHFPHIGFILSLKEDLHTEDMKFPGNVLLLTWVPQNDLLGDDRVHAFITHGGVNSLLESLYHAKPMVVIGTSIDQVNTSVLVAYRKYGFGVTRDAEVTYDFFVNSIQEIISNPIYKQNCLLAQKLVREVDGKEVFYYWLNYILEYGYEHLLVPALKDYSYIQLYNLDVGLVWILIVYVLYKILSMPLLWLLKRAFVKKL